jgi:N-acetylmuramoyl-L-alanine amidase
MEKDVALAISKKLEELLVEAGAKVVMTRTDDSYLYMSERAEIIRTNKAELMVSIHANSIGYATDPREMKGTGSFYKHMAYKPLAEIMYNKMRELGLDDYGLTGSFNFSLNAPTDFPNVLVETAFLSNPEEEIFLLDPYYQRRIAQQIVEGLEEYYTQYAWWSNEELKADK